jgi:hypothetical protein
LWVYSDVRFEPPVQHRTVRLDSPANVKDTQPVPGNALHPLSEALAAFDEAQVIRVAVQRMKAPIS